MGLGGPYLKGILLSFLSGIDRPFCLFFRFLLKQGACLTAVNCDGDVPLDIALDETTESLLQDYTLKQGG